MAPQSKLTSINEFRTYRRNLPHWESPGSLYFVTFRTADGLVLSDAAKDITFASVKFHAEKKYRLYACVVMDSHVHTILQPLERPLAQESQARRPVPRFYGLSQITHSIKSYSANRIQRLLNRTGRVWLDENYDRIVRDEKEYLETLDYVVHNPVEAGVVHRPEDYKWLVAEGWAS